MTTSNYFGVSNLSFDTTLDMLATIGQRPWYSTPRSQTFFKSSNNWTQSFAHIYAHTYKSYYKQYL